MKYGRITPENGFNFPDRKAVALRVSNNIKHLRNVHKMSRKEVGDLIGVSIDTVKNWERFGQMPSWPRLFQIAHVFSCTVGDLIEEKPVQVVYIEGNAQDMIKSLEFFIRNQKKFSRVPIDVLRACVPAENHAKLRQFFAGIEVKELPKPILNPFVAREKAAKARKWYRDMRERRYQAELARGNIPVANYLPEDLAPKPTPETDDLENT